MKLYSNLNVEVEDHQENQIGREGLIQVRNMIKVL